jgi:aminopeptidase N
VSSGSRIGGIPPIILPVRLRLTALFLLTPIVLAADTYPRQPGIDVVHYVFRLTLSDASSEIAGETTVTVKFLQERVSNLSLDLTSLSVSTGMTVQSVRRGGPIDIPGSITDNIAFTHLENRLRVTLPAPTTAGQELTFTIRYKGTPAAGLRIGSNMHGERTFFGENWPNLVRNWLPMIDHPYDKATGEFVVTAPAHYQVVANGALVEETDLPGNHRRTHWRQSVPIASWLYTIAVARFTAHTAGAVDGIPIQSWVFPQDRDAGLGLFEDTSRRALLFFASQIGPYPYQKLANVQATGFTGGTEYASAIFYGEKGVSSGRGPVVHEIAHQWFGDSVTEKDWDDVWLSEGFATYFALLFTEHDEGRDAFVEGLKRSRAQVLQVEQKLPDTPVIHRNLSDMGKVLNGLVYQKGGWVLHMLRQEVGTENFWKGIREYYRRYRDSNVSTTELRAVFEQVSGKPLDWFFTQWLTRPGVPKIEGSWRYDASKKMVEVRITQAQAGSPFRLKMDVGIVEKAGGLPTVETIEIAAKQGTHMFQVAAPPVDVILDPNTTVLMESGPLSKR